ncbi:type IX secretion system sortase PorU [Aquirufa sp. ROCK-SH2]
MHKLASSILKGVKIKFATLLILLACVQINFQLTAQYKSNLAEGKWIKIAISESGFYRINYEWLLKNQIDPNTINPQKIGLYGNSGGYLPQLNSIQRPNDLLGYVSQFIGEDDGHWDKNDYLLFYGQSPHKTYWDTLTNRLETKINPYSDSTYYFIRLDDPKPIRITSKIVKQGSPPYVDYGYYSFHYEQELNNLIQSGREWLGESFSSNSEKKLMYELTDYKKDSQSLLYGRVYNASIQAAEWNLQLPGSSNKSIQIPAINNSRYDIKALPAEFAYSLTPLLNTNSWECKLQYKSSGGSGYLDKISLVYPKLFNAKSSQSNYWLPNQVDSVFSIKIINLEEQHQIWQLENDSQWTRYENPIENPQITSKSQAQLFIFDPNNASSPQYSGIVKNQNLHELSAKNLLIVSTEMLLPLAQKYAEYKNKFSSVSATAVSTEQIFNEFSAGQADITAIRDFIRHLKKQTNSSLKYLLILGDASVDFKGKNSVTSEIEKKAIVPSYQSRESLHPLLSYVSDDYYGILDTDGGELLEGDLVREENLQIGIGRIPARTYEEANMLINKLITYQESQKKSPIQNFTFSWVADDGDNNLHIQDAEDFEKIIQSSTSVYPIKKLYLDQYPQEVANGFYTSQAAKKDVIELFNKNADFIHFIGHGAETGWTDEKILTVTELVNLKNSQHLPMLLTATCQFGRFDDPNQMSGAEIALLSNQGGAITLISTSRPVFQSSNYLFGKKFYENLVQHQTENGYLLGDLFKDTKNKSQAGVINRNIILLGDPSMDLPWKHQKSAISNNQIKPQSTEFIKGSIPNLIPMNGTGELQILQKPDKKKTLGTKTPIYEYQIEGKLLQKAKISVKNGLFQLNQQYIPAIKTDSVLLRFSGTFENGLKIMGSKTVAIELNKETIDQTPPSINFKLLNEKDPNQASRNPILAINIVDDKALSFWGPNGETSEMVINDTLQINTLDYFSSEMDQANSGQFIYPFKQLKNGQYHCQFICWDSNLNVSTKIFDFTVNDNPNSNQTINVYPNPSNDQIHFNFDLQKKWTDCEYEIKLYNILGQTIWEDKKQVNSNETGKIEIDLSLNESGISEEHSLIVYSIKIINLLDRYKYQFSGKIGVVR